MIFLRLTLMLLACLAILLALLSYLMARFLLRPPRMTDGKAVWVLKRLTPLDIGLSFTPLTFTVRDEHSKKPLQLAAWWIPHNNSGKTAILLHGYADAKVGAIAWAPLFHELGHNILALDLRAHGESGGEISSAGYWERHDLVQILNDLRARYPHQTQHIILFGASLGAAVAIALAAEPIDIDALILESPFADFRHAASAHFHLLGISLPLLHRAAIFLSEKLAHADFATIRPLDLIPKSHAPILIIQGEDDALTPLEDQQQLERAISQRNDTSTYWRLENVPHLMSLISDPTTYRQRLSDFLSDIQLQIANRESQIPMSPSSHPTQ
ncbi:MAG TPA: alpha/beta hydrolase [Tepidisphaeraceae bacterium]|nr:alpha/beta hydrolase [Tepidisphaeraceae bacterium]